MIASLIDVILSVFWLIELFILGAVVASWPLSRKIPGPLDWAPFIVLLGIEVIKRVLIHLVH
jgi:hypothetical protein